VVRSISGYRFSDEKWLSRRSDCRDKPLNIYEVHLGSWKRVSDEDENGWYTYSEIADMLIEHVLECGYNYIEFMPLSEHPADESWGYQITGFFAPTSRYGTPAQLMELIDKCHRNGIGVIMDFVPFHFAVDHYALTEYDGTRLTNSPMTRQLTTSGEAGTSCTQRGRFVPFCSPRLITDWRSIMWTDFVWTQYAI
jgi:1,4-alpha-glucan branching enzyme